MYEYLDCYLCVPSLMRMRIQVYAEMSTLEFVAYMRDVEQIKN